MTKVKLELEKNSLYTKIDEEIKKGIKKKINNISSLVGLEEAECHPLLNAELNNAPDCFQKVAEASNKYKNCIADEMRVDQDEGWFGEQAYFRESRRCTFFLENLLTVKKECFEEVCRKMAEPSFNIK